MEIEFGSIDMEAQVVLRDLQETSYAIMAYSSDSNN